MTTPSLLLAERYALGSAIARGGMATVWEARDEVLARTVAVKILHPHLSDDESFLERFRREAYAAARLTHPNIVAIYDTGFDRDEHGGERHYIVMEHCGGGTLADLARRSGGRLPPEEVASIGLPICDALEYAHAAGIVHRDIKPANVLRAGSGSLKVGDFGIAKAATEAGDITTTGTILGTVTYLSPEQARGEEPDARSDIYSLGIVLYELLVGRVPFQAESQVATALMHVNAAPAAPRSIVPTLPKNLENVVMRAMSKEPDDRYGSAGEMRDALLAAGGGTGQTSVLRVPATQAAASSPSGRPGRSEMRWLLPVLFLIGLAIVAVIVLPGLMEEEDPVDPGTSEQPERVPPIDITAATSFDPEGDEEEHETEVPAAYDNDAATGWTTEGYQTSFSDQKSGVGLLLDLGSDKEVTEVEVRTATPGIDLEIRTADSEPSSIDDTTLVGSAPAASARERITLDDATAARYWIVWVTKLPGSDTGSAQISEVEFSSG